MEGDMIRVSRGKEQNQSGRESGLKLEKDLHKDFQISEMRGSAAQACMMLKTLANEDRLLILCQLIDGPRTVGELESLLGIRQPTLSQQLTVLRQEGLVSTERKGKYIIYSLASSEAVQIMQTLYSLYCGTKSGEGGEGGEGSDHSAKEKCGQA